MLLYKVGYSNGYLVRACLLLMRIWNELINGLTVVTFVEEVIIAVINMIPAVNNDTLVVGNESRRSLSVELCHNSIHLCLNECQSEVVCHKIIVYEWTILIK